MLDEHVFDAYVEQLICDGLFLAVPERSYLNIELFAPVLGSLIDDFDRRGTLRARDVLPEDIGAEVMRGVVRTVCRSAGAVNNPDCEVWHPPGRELSRIPAWDTSCKSCRKPSATRKRVCGVAFPASPKRQGLRRRSISVPALVKPDHFKAWTAGLKPVPINRAIDATVALYEQGHEPDTVSFYMLTVLATYRQLQRDLRWLKRVLLRNWDRMLTKQEIMQVVWIGGDVRPACLFIPANGTETLQPVDLKAYPEAHGSEMFSAIGGNRRNRHPRVLQSKPVIHEIRITPYPLPSDEIPAGTESGALQAVRLFIRPRMGKEDRPNSAAFLLQLASNLG